MNVLSLFNGMECASLCLEQAGAQVVSDSQAYKMIGNGWQCDTITHILNHMPHA